ncbi:unnamed protein product [Rotaria sp. Silwood1]|nr:unnamed protein product [Rotaria sp. Silwood1]CAF3351085.1 unnamed protein product [Rotaria sp. Silwood1]CAF3374031.1 unnamed protein product [Rotaria sp. Silwood1]CAF3378629.1 unnamed protein product [Rotaria sp. Silwood1]CAF4633979.1 unnamed protein product [Rotaria sp. Silwood1]
MSVDISDLLPVLESNFESSVTLSGVLSRREKYKHAITMGVLFFINLLNFMDRFIIAGVLDKIIHDFSVGEAKGGLLQTVFVCSYMALAPVFGYLGDRYSRKMLIIVGVSIWSMTTLAGSFVPNHMFAVFAILRGLVGIGEASYSCVAPTIIADMYKHDTRTRMLALFNIATPVGGGLGYIVGAYVTVAFHGDWRWALRFTPALGFICVILLIVLVREPVRGGADGAQVLKRDSWVLEIQRIFQVKSFVLTTLGFTWVAFALGSLAWWAPRFLQLAYSWHYNIVTEKMKANVSLYFGIVTCGAGLLGVLLGSEVARWYRKRNQRGDPIVCGVAVILAIPFLFIVLIISKHSIIATWICIAITETLLSSNWAIISDMLMYIIIPPRRATASSIQIFILHLLGDASSPYIVGIISEALGKGSKDEKVIWQALRNALMLTPTVACCGGIAFLIAALFIIRDRREAEATIQLMNLSDNIRMEEKQ